MIDIGSVGLWVGILDEHPTGRVREVCQEIEAMGWPTLWRQEARGRDALVASAIMLESTTTLNIATGIAQMHARHAHTTAAAQRTLHESSGGRFLLGLGVSHAPLIEGVRKLEYKTPYSDMVAYLDAMAEAPFDAVAAADEPDTVLAALGPRMLKLAAERTQGAHPYFVPPEHSAVARETMGPDALLAPEQMVIIDTDLGRARELAKASMARYLAMPNYANNLRRLGFTEDDLAGPSDKLADAIVACGGVDEAVARVAEHHDAGADHVCIQVLVADPQDLPLPAWRDLAAAFDLR
ncbi:MAG: TIGR03620 family F420-dependent LLM class oxidoreductase [Acidimicrobiales bacterium]